MQHAKDLTPKDKWWSRDEGVQEVRKRNSTLMVEAMASCTAVTYVDGNLVGDPLDVQMFEATGWILDESNQRKDDPNDDDQMIIADVYPAQAKEDFGQKSKRHVPSVSSQSSFQDGGKGVFKTALIRRFDFSS